jgi:hypothetical protein
MQTTEPTAADNRRARVKRAPWLDKRPRRDPNALPVHRHSQAREVACEMMGIRYGRVEAPRRQSQLDEMISPFAEDRKGANPPKSWEILTDSF